MQLVNVELVVHEYLIQYAVQIIKPTPIRVFWSQKVVNVKKEFLLSTRANVVRINQLRAAIKTTRNSITLMIVLFSILLGVQKPTTKPFDICDISLCDFGRCVNVDGNATCQCVELCPLTHDPVCGSDNKTYPNLCALELDSCQRKEHISVKHKGLCGKKLTTVIVEE